MRKTVTALLTFLAGAYFILEFVLPATMRIPLIGVQFENPFSPYYGLATDLIIVIGTMAFLLGPLNLVRAHATNMVRRRANWSASAVFLVFFFGSVLIAGARSAAEIAGRAPDPVVTRAFDFLFYGINFAFGTTSMGLLTFYLVSAAYRSFRITGLDSAIMFIAATIILLGRTPFGDALTQGAPYILKLATWEEWLMRTPNAAVQRAVLIGTFAGAFAASLRYWLGIGTRAAEQP